ncbi:MAG: hypothetical protein ACEPOV_14300 [Hyphomicrobiales bacterium]
MKILNRKHLLVIEKEESGSNRFSLYKVDNLKNDINIKFLGAFKKEVLTKHLPKIALLDVIISGSYILSKNIKGISSERELFENAFPYLNSVDFIYQYDSETGECFLCRRESYENMMSQLLGEEVLFSRLFLIESDMISKYKDYVQSDASMSRLNLYGLPSKDIFKSINLRRLFYLILFVGIAFVFFLLLINYAFFSFNYKKSEILNQQIKESYLDIKVKEKLLKEYNEERAIIDNAGLISNSTLTYFVDRINGTIPEDIVLNEFLVFPISTDKRIKKMSFQNTDILIAGFFSLSQEFNSWLTGLAYLDWVKEVIVLNVNERKGEKSFRIKIKTK